MSIIEDLVANDYILTCTNCEAKTYKYTGPKPIDPKSAIKAQDWDPVDDMIMPPRPGYPITCPYCGYGLLFVRKESHDRPTNGTN